MNSSKTAPDLKLNDGSAVRVENFGDFLLLRAVDKSNKSLVRFARVLFDANFAFVVEVIATEVEICVAIDRDFDLEMASALESIDVATEEAAQTTSHELLIHFPDNFGDWDRIEAHARIDREAFMDQLLGCDLSVAMIGFLPGFVYLNGLPKQLQVPRKETPSTETMANTFAVGGKYGGIYSLPSAAGWNCVGLIAESIFNTKRLPPVLVGQGDSIKLKRIDGAEYAARQNVETAGHRDASILTDENTHGIIEVLKATGLSLIQDQGRQGLAWYAIPASGPMDSSSADMANTILGNTPESPLIECHLVAPAIEFQSSATICLTGADMQWNIDGDAVKRNRTIDVSPGSVLSGSAATDGCRSYIAIRGLIDTEKSFGSSSCYMPGKFGGNHGKPLSACDRIQWIKPTNTSGSLSLDLTIGNDESELLLHSGPEFDWMDSDSRKALFAAEFSVSRQSNRMGARLDGPRLSSGGRKMTDSVPLLPGMIQLTPDGQCIVVLQDGQTTGGYPRIAYLDRKSVERLNQTKIGHPLRFRMAE